MWKRENKCEPLVYYGPSKNIECSCTRNNKQWRESFSIRSRGVDKSLISSVLIFSRFGGRVEEENREFQGRKTRGKGFEANKKCILRKLKERKQRDKCGKKRKRREEERGNVKKSDNN